MTKAMPDMSQGDITSVFIRKSSIPPFQLQLPGLPVVAAGKSLANALPVHGLTRNRY